MITVSYFLGQCEKSARAFRALGLAYVPACNAWEIPADKRRAATIAFQEAYRYDPRESMDRPADHAVPALRPYKTFEEQREDARIERAAKRAGVNTFKYQHGRCEDAPCCGCCDPRDFYYPLGGNEGW